MNDAPVKALLVEDSPTDAQLLCESLGDYPQQRFEVAHAERLDEAMDRLRNGSFDVILLDLNLPDSRGIRTCERMVGAAGQTPVIILTGADDETLAVEAMRLGVQDYLVKGTLSGNVVGRAVRYAVERSRSQRALQQSEERYRTLFTNMSEGFALGEAVFHEDGAACDFHFLEINDAFERQTGLTREILGRSITEVLPHVEPHWIDTYCDVARTGRSVRFVEFNKDTGRHYDVFCYSPAKNRFAILFRDVTDRVRTERAMQEATNRLQEQKEELQVQAEELQSQAEELRATNEALESREREYRTLAENTPEVIARLDRRLRHTYINAYGARVYGVPQRAVLGKTSAELGMPPEKVAFWRERFEQVLATGQQQIVDFEFDSPTLGHRYFSSIFVPEFDARGEVVSILAITRDVTATRKAQEALRSVALFPEQNPTPVLRVARDGTLLYANGVSAGLLDLWCCRVGQRVPQEIRRHVEDSLAAGKATEAEIACGEVVYSFSIAPIASEDYVNLYGRDVTERKRAEEALRQSEARHRRLIENLKGSHFVYVHDTSGVFRYISESIAAILGYAPQEFLAHYGAYLTDHPANQTARRCTELSIQGIRQPPFQVHIRHKDGSTRWLEVQEVPVFDAEGKVAAVEGVAQDITERKRAEEALRESEQWFRTLANTMPQLVWTADPDGRVDYYNERYREYRGIEPTEDGAFRWSPVLHPDDVRPTAEVWERAVRTGETYQIEHRVQRADGSYRWHLSRGMPIRDSEGRIVKWFGTATDIDSLKRAEEAWRASEMRLRTVLATLPVGVLIVDRANTIVDTNGYFERLYAGGGALPSALQEYRRGRAWWPDSGEPVLDDGWPSAEALRRGVVVPSQEIEIEQADGARATVLDAAAPLRDERGEVTGAVVVVQDITDRKRVEQALRQSESFYRQTLESIPGMVFTTRPDGYCDYQSQQWEDYTGVPMAEHLGGGWNKLLHPEDRPRALAAWRNAVEGRAAYNLEYRVRRHDGQYEWFKVIGQPIRDEAGRIVRWFGVAINIEAIKQAEESLRGLTRTLEMRVAERTQELEHRARQLQKLTLELSQTEDRERRRLADILHDDLQQQLAAVKFHLGLLNNRAKGDPALQRTAARLDRMLADAIETSRSLSHELSPATLYQGSLGETFEWLASQIRSKHGLDVSVRADGEIYVESDALRAFLYKAGQELLFNVVKHARVPEARVRVRRMGGCVCLVVSDRGRGFDPQGLKAAAGFGLFSIRERVQLLGGRMRIKSAEGKGSTFFIAVPDSLETEQGGPETQARDDRAPASSDSVLRVLVADDHEVVRQGLAALLEEQNDIRLVGEAANGREAVDMASRLRPDVVVMDVSMPLMSGDEATRQTKLHLPGTRVIALSMHADDGMVEKMRRAGAESYVLKTAPADELLAAIRGRKVCA